MSPRTARAVFLILLSACFLFAGDKSSASASTTNGLTRTITFAERLAYQRAIEEVFWRHRLWPKENAGPKPSLDTVLSPAVLEKKVRDYLRQSQALEDYWQPAITAEQLQAEMNRMARDTKQPEVLNELFEALGNDPFVIAECLARPALAERFLSNQYAYDQRIHGEIKQRVQAELRSHTTVEQLKQLGGEYSESEFVRCENNEHLQNSANGSRKLTGREWDATVKNLATMFNRHGDAVAETYKIIPIGKPSLLQEDETHFFVIAIVEKTADSLKLATVTWPKELLEAWLAKAESEIREAAVTGSAIYILPSISAEAVGCDDTWTPTPLQFQAPAGPGTQRCGLEVK